MMYEIWGRKRKIHIYENMELNFTNMCVEKEHEASEEMVSFNWVHVFNKQIDQWVVSRRWSAQHAFCWCSEDSEMRPDTEERLWSICSFPSRCSCFHVSCGHFKVFRDNQASRRSFLDQFSFVQFLRNAFFSFLSFPRVRSERLI
jgi:hypothetical protein